MLYRATYIAAPIPIPAAFTPPNTYMCLTDAMPVGGDVGENLESAAPAAAGRKTDRRPHFPLSVQVFDLPKDFIRAWAPKKLS